MNSPNTAQLEARLDSLLETLRLATSANRCTLRIDDSARGWHVDYIVAESAHSGVNSLRGVGSIDQWAAATVKWMLEHRRLLVQPNLLNAPDPAPPPELIRLYGVTAQMLSPIFSSGGNMTGWISVHYMSRPHEPTDAELQALSTANASIVRLLEMDRGSTDSEV